MRNYQIFYCKKKIPYFQGISYDISNNMFIFICEKCIFDDDILKKIITFNFSNIILPN